MLLIGDMVNYNITKVMGGGGDGGGGGAVYKPYGESENNVSRCVLFILSPQSMMIHDFGVILKVI
jgi:hypothetical protein